MYFSKLQEKTDNFFDKKSFVCSSDLHILTDLCLFLDDLKKNVSYSTLKISK